MRPSRAARVVTQRADSDRDSRRNRRKSYGGCRGLAGSSLGSARSTMRRRTPGGVFCRSPRRISFCVPQGAASCCIERELTCAHQGSQLCRGWKLLQLKPVALQHRYWRSTTSVLEHFPRRRIRRQADWALLSSSTDDRRFSLLPRTARCRISICLREKNKPKY
jgi:hypothetical protein